jgi:hypothetical protein
MLRWNMLRRATLAGENCGRMPFFLNEYAESDSRKRFPWQFVSRNVKKEYVPQFFLLVQMTALPVRLRRAALERRDVGR